MCLLKSAYAFGVQKQEAQVDETTLVKCAYSFAI
jgi:hypothetical protein